VPSGSDVSPIRAQISMIMHVVDTRRAQNECATWEAQSATSLLPHALDAAKIRNWPFRNGWKPGAADELAKLMNKIVGFMARPHLTNIPNAKTRYTSWKGGGD
jgi:hypothetical protein